MGLSETLHRDAGCIEAWLNEYFKKMGRVDGYPAGLLQAAGYSLFAGGKRLRPCLVMMSNRLFDGEQQDILPVAGALELIHTYSLIHDDLPAMDDDDLRRGKPTCHIRYGEAEAILAGDALLTEAFGMCAQTGCPPDRIVRMIRLLSDLAGFSGMVAGQSADLAAEKKPVDKKGLRFIHENKTGALIIASLLLPAVANGASAEQETALREYGLALGMLFQITDDILDVSGDTDKLGKPAGSDERQGKSTFVSLYGLDNARGMAEEWCVRAEEALSPFGEKAENLGELSRFILERDY